MTLIPKPLPGEYDPYTIAYIKHLPDDGNLLHHLRSNGEMMTVFFRSLPREKWEYRYAPGKWTIKDILLHIIDDERIFAYRALWIARGDTTPLAGFDQEPYAVAGKANDRSAESLLEEYTAVRKATLTLFENLPGDAWNRTGTANDHPVSVRALAYILAGHELHHLGVIKEKYL